MKKLVSKADLEQMALNEIKALSGGETVTSVLVEYFPDPDFDSNWRIVGVVCRWRIAIIAGSEHGLTATSRAIELTQLRLRDLFNLLVEMSDESAFVNRR